MKKILSIVVVAVVFLGVLWYFKGHDQSDNSPSPSASPTASQQALHSVSDGTITVTFDPSQFGLATTPSQVIVHSYIPPCDQNFNYCLYFTGKQYAGSNFESAGIRIQKRADLSTKPQCLTTPPEGYDASVTPLATTTQNGYSVSAFNAGGAGAGHIAAGTLYHVYTNNTCYEFETRVGQSQYANYPAGTIKEFTAADEASLLSLLKSVVSRVMLPGGTRLILP